MADTPQQKHAGLTALGALSVLLGSFFLVSGFWGLLQPEALRGMTAAAQMPQLLSGFSAAWAYADAALNIVLAIMLFLAGVGLLRLRTWGASLAITYAVGRILLSIVSFVVALIGPIAHRPTGDALAALPEPLATFFKLKFFPIALTESIAALLLSVVFAVILLCLLSRPSYRENLS